MDKRRTVTPSGLEFICRKSLSRERWFSSFHYLVVILTWPSLCRPSAVVRICWDFMITLAVCFLQDSIANPLALEILWPLPCVPEPWRGCYICGLSINTQSLILSNYVSVFITMDWHKRIFWLWLKVIIVYG